MSIPGMDKRQMKYVKNCRDQALSSCDSVCVCGRKNNMGGLELISGAHFCPWCVTKYGQKTSLYVWKKEKTIWEARNAQYAVCSAYFAFYCIWWEFSHMKLFPFLSCAVFRILPKFELLPYFFSFWLFLSLLLSSVLQQSVACFPFYLSILFHFCQLFFFLFFFFISSLAAICSVFFPYFSIFI